MAKRNKKGQPEGKPKKKDQQKPSLRDKLLLAAALIELISKLIDLIRGK